MWRIQGLLGGHGKNRNTNTLVEHAADEPQHSSDAPQHSKPSLLKDSLGTFLFSRIPQHDRVRFEAALGVQQRTGVHAGSAMQYDELNHHINMQLQAKEQNEEHLQAQADAARKKKLLKQASSMRRKVNQACGDEKTWRRNQGRASMARVSIKLPGVAGEGKQSMAFKGGLTPDPSQHVEWVSVSAEDDWLSQHTKHQQASTTSFKARGAVSQKSFTVSGKGQASGKQLLGGEEAAGWLSKTRAFMKGVVGKLTTSADTDRPDGDPEDVTCGTTPPPAAAIPLKGRKSEADLFLHMRSRRRAALTQGGGGGGTAEAWGSGPETGAADPPVRSWHSAPKLNRGGGGGGGGVPSGPSSSTSLTPDPQAARPPPGCSATPEPWTSRGAPALSMTPEPWTAHRGPPSGALSTAPEPWTARRGATSLHLQRPRASGALCAGPPSLGSVGGGGVQEPLSSAPGVGGGGQGVLCSVPGSVEEGRTNSLLRNALAAPQDTIKLPGIKLRA